ncbi:MAG: pilus assembly protein [Candidatus Dormibacteraeota bacterium]|nr:pilus assembly protein [Candidatus Dormibacteraeota bacterium]
MARAPFQRGRPAAQRRRQRGQGLVEFALVAPVFFLLIFAMVDGGFLLYGVNAVDHAATIGSNELAALGNSDGSTNTADFTALNKMASAGLTTTALIKITEIDVQELVPNSNGDGFKTNADGTPMVWTTSTSPTGVGCTGGPTDSEDGSGACTNQYAFNSSGAYLLAGAWSSCASSTGDPSQCPPWPPGARDITAGQSSFVALKVSYTYTFFTDISGHLNLTTTKTFRLEPEVNVGT